MLQNRTSISTWALVSVLIMLGLGCGQNEKHTPPAPLARKTESTPCETCPQLREGQDTVAFAREVMRFVAESTDYGQLHHPLCDTFHRIAIAELPVQELLNIFERDEGTTSCGLSAAMTVKMLLDNGIDAYAYDFGFKDTGLTHVVVLVRVDSRYLIFDPYFNTEPKWQDGQNVDLMELLSAMPDTAQMMQFSYEDQPVVTEYLIDFASEDVRQKMGQHIPKACADMAKNRVWLRDSIYKIEIERCFGCDTSNHCGSFINSFEKALSLRTPFRSLYQATALKITDIVGGQDSRAVNAMIDSIIAVNLPQQATDGS